MLFLVLLHWESLIAGGMSVELTCYIACVSCPLTLIGVWSSTGRIIFCIILIVVHIFYFVVSNWQFSVWNDGSCLSMCVVDDGFCWSLLLQCWSCAVVTAIVEWQRVECWSVLSSWFLDIGYCVYICVCVSECLCVRVSVRFLFPECGQF